MANPEEVGGEELVPAKEVPCARAVREGKLKEIMCVMQFESYRLTDATIDVPAVALSDSPWSRSDCTPSCWCSASFSAYKISNSCTIWPNKSANRLRTLTGSVDPKGTPSTVPKSVITNELIKEVKTLSRTGRHWDSTMLMRRLSLTEYLV